MTVNREFLTIVLIACSASVSNGAEKTVPLTITGGHETEPEDRGRPVALVAGGLGVKPEVFREAFRGVTPSRNGPPTEAEARRNKEALMKVLKPYGITNERLDEVSNRYRYRREKGELWPTSSARGHAVVVDGTVTKIVITDGGFGYNSAPTVKVQGMENVRLKAMLHFDKDLKKNGSITSVDVVGS